MESYIFALWGKLAHYICMTKANVYQYLKISYIQLMSMHGETIVITKKVRL